MAATTYTFSPVTDTDRAGVVWVAAILSLMFTVITLATRFQIKAHALGKDDYLIGLSTLVAVAQYIAIFVGLNRGVGRSSTLLTESYAQTLGRSVLASEILFIASMMLSKLSVVVFLKRLLSRDHSAAWMACQVTVALTVAWGVGSALGISVECGPDRILYGPTRCVHKLLRWELVISFDAVLECIYVGLAICLVWPLQMKRRIKTTVVFAFAFRLICAVFAALHGVWIDKYVDSDDPGLAIADVLVWQQVCLGYSLIATTIPTIKTFVRGYNKELGYDPSSEKRGLGGGYNLGSLVRSINRTGPESGSGNSSRQQRSNASRSGQRSFASRSRQDQENGNYQMGPKSGDYRVGAFHDAASKGKHAKRPPSGIFESDEDPIIRRDVSVTVETERASRTNSDLGV
ncbi:hypothetical protein CBER1_09098 [Cercospora berteroae]|uniref:Rhodopsin domain-containing protein n=1 Tax=Cercospora berteroae TaxID=357750 RepID=A0A2S6C8X5_9PEZI|nr:hypothetical protein CBER1_09098 [Cercospora berteroae]